MYIFFCDKLQIFELWEAKTVGTKILSQFIKKWPKTSANKLQCNSLQWFCTTLEFYQFDL